MKFPLILIAMVVTLTTIVGVSVYQLTTFDRQMKTIFQDYVVPMKTVQVAETDFARARANRLVAVLQSDAVRRDQAIERAQRFFESGRSELKQLAKIQPGAVGDLMGTVDQLASIFDRPLHQARQEGFLLSFESFGIINDRLGSIANHYQTLAAESENSAQRVHSATITFIFGALIVFGLLLAAFVHQLVLRTLPLARQLVPILETSLGGGHSFTAGPNS